MGGILAVSAFDNPFQQLFENEVDSEYSFQG